MKNYFFGQKIALDPKYEDVMLHFDYRSQDHILKKLLFFEVALNEGFRKIWSDFFHA